MRLVRAELEGYRSIQETLEIHFDRRVTVLLGANDHGKSNLLSGLVHLNDDAPFDRETDLNWNVSQRSSELPRVMFEFELDGPEKAELLRRENALRRSAFVTTAIEGARTRLQEANQHEQECRAESVAADEALENAESKLQALRAERRLTAEENQSYRASVVKLRGDAKRLASNLQRAVSELEAARSTLPVLLAREIEEKALNRAEPPENALDAYLAEANSKLNAAKAQATASQAEQQAANKELEEATPSGEDTRIQTAQRQLRSANQKVQESATKVADAERELTLAQHIVDAGKKSLAEGSKFGAEGISQILNAMLEVLDEANVPGLARMQRLGIGGSLLLMPLDGVECDTSFLLEGRPRVELILPTQTIPDSVNLEELEREDSSGYFMRGIFFYAGLERAEWPGLFVHNDESGMRLEGASRDLDKRLKESWSQGSNLRFMLRLDSGEAKIDLRLEDPNIGRRYVRVSQRSSGFTHFFALKTIMYAREKEQGTNSFIWLFDEPGIYLHPEGQHDLLKVIETLADANQIIYSTHSLFMLNKNHPIRHRLLTKKGNGTTLEGKPYRARWGPVREALGLSLPGTILFASKVLLVEGDSDPIFVNAILQGLSDLDQLAVDINAFAAIATLDSKNADVLLRTLTEAEPRPQVAFLFDSDPGGDDRFVDAKATIKSIETQDYQIPCETLPVEDTCIEDYLIGGVEFYVNAAIRYTVKTFKKSEPEVTKALREALKEPLAKPNVQSKGLKTQVISAIKSVVGNKSPSTLGLAREYQLYLEEILDDPEARAKISKRSIGRARNLANKIIRMLDLPNQVLSPEEQEEIVADLDVEPAADSVTAAS